MNFKHRYIYACVFIVFSFYTVRGQDVYFRVSENDCVNCYAGFYETLTNLNEEYKFLFPENYKGKRFDNFNKTYFSGDINQNNVFFSDSLYERTGRVLQNRSGCILVMGNDILAVMQMEELESKKEYIHSFSELSVLFDLQEEGVSNRLNKNVLYEKDCIFVIDDLYRKIYSWDSNSKINRVNLKDKKFHNILSKVLSKEKYDFHISNVNHLKKYGKDTPEAFFSYIHESKLYLNFYMPYIEYEGKSDSLGFSLSVNNCPVISVVPIGDSKLSVDRIIKNSYIDNDLANLDYFSTITIGAYKDKIYRINQLFGEKEKYNQKFPLFSVFSIDDKSRHITFKGYSSEIENFQFQQDSLLSKNGLVVNTSFIGDEENFVLTNMPYAINIKEKRKYKLDWSENLNDIHYSQDIKYENIQLWENNLKEFCIVLKQENYFYLKTYNASWKLIDKIKLPFNTDIIKDVRFTKDAVYLFTEDELLKMPNKFEK